MVRRGDVNARPLIPEGMRVARQKSSTAFARHKKSCKLLNRMAH